MLKQSAQPRSRQFMRNAPHFGRAFPLLFAVLPLLALNASANLITNGSFETVTPALPANGICTTAPAIYPYGACSAPGWTGNYQVGNGATIGIYGVSFGIPQPDPDGHNALILQSNVATAIQSLSIPTAGSYTLDFYIANRSNVNNGPQSVDVSLDGTTVTGGVFSHLPAAWSLETLTFDLTAATHTLTFSGVDTGDVSAFIDDISLNQATVAASAPEPATFALFALAIASLGVIRKHRDNRVL